MRIIPFLALVLTFGFGLSSADLAAQVVTPEAVPHSERQPASAASRHSQATTPAPTKAGAGLLIALEPLLRPQQQVVPRKDGPAQIGVGRLAPAPYDSDLNPQLSWTVAEDGSRTTSLTVQSPGAAALRVALDLSVPQGTRLWVHSDAESFGPFHADELNPQAGKETEQPAWFWSPVLEGDTLTVSLRLPTGADPATVALEIRNVSHLNVSPGNPDKSLTDIGASGSCNIDINCLETVPPQKDAVVKYVYSDSSGSFTCTGTLMGDTDGDSRIPYIVTARHCFENPTVLIDSLTTYWFFERASCGGPAPQDVVQVPGGAEFITFINETDFAMLQSHNPPPEGAVFSGWTAEPMSAGAVGFAIHHPGGDLKKFTLGQVSGLSDYAETSGQDGSHIRMLWQAGTTEVGSSGGPLFGPNGLFRGQLHGGDASCSNPSGFDWYGRFDQSFPTVRPLLFEERPQLSDGQSVTGQLVAGQSAEFKVYTSSANPQLTLTLETTQGDMDLYVGRNNRPTVGDNGGFVCRSINASTQTDACTLTNDGNNVYYVRVRGFQTGSYRLSLSMEGPANGGGNRVQLSGTVHLQGQPLCAMVLANGEYMFSCGGDGRYQLNVPLEQDGSVTLFSFVDGLAPFSQTFTPQQSSMQFDVAMSPDAGSPTMNVVVDTLQALGGNRALIGGQVLFGDQPVCAMVLANGQYMFSCGGEGRFELDVPLDASQQITLFTFAQGFAPLRRTLGF